MSKSFINEELWERTYKSLSLSNILAKALTNISNNVPVMMYHDWEVSTSRKQFF